MKPKHILSLLLVAVIMSFLASCEYEFIKPEPPPPPPEPTDTVSFSQEVQPIFESNSCTSCHKPGGAAGLDLTIPDAYNSIISNGLVDTADPASSKIYTFPHPATGDHNYKYASEAEANTVFYWIEQGAHNN